MCPAGSIARARGAQMPVAEHPVGKRRRGGQRPIDGRFVDDHCRATERRRRRLTSSEMPIGRGRKALLAGVRARRSERPSDPAGSDSVAFPGEGADQVANGTGQTGTVTDNELEVVSYDKIWPDRAAALIELLANALGDKARRIEHIGSTAVAGMDAKDILDLQVSVVDLESAIVDFDDGLKSVGFVRLPYAHDHVPAGRDDDPERWVKRMWARREHPQGDVNLHVRLVGSPNERLALLFRDWLRAHPESVPAYSAFKRALAAAVPTVDVYTDIKDPVVDLVVVVAEEWAATTGWHITSTSST
jgi:GrpB-like predicted nucleotidyltransferase (UPF0157 family)